MPGKMNKYKYRLFHTDCKSNLPLFTLFCSLSIASGEETKNSESYKLILKFYTLIGIRR